MYTKLTKKLRIENLNNIFQNCNFVLQQFHVLHPFLSATHFRSTCVCHSLQSNFGRTCTSIIFKNLLALLKKNVLMQDHANDQKAEGCWSNSFVKTTSHFFATTSHISQFYACTSVPTNERRVVASNILMH